MKHRILISLSIIALCLPLSNFAQDTEVQTPYLRTQDFEIALGEWNGTLTYVDYSSGQPYTMPADLKVGKGNSSRTFSLNYSYPNEPQANSKGKLKISKNGLLLNGNKLISKVINDDGILEVVTSHMGKDNKKRATIRNIYELGTSLLIIRKEVKFIDSDEWFKRNEYSFTRAPEGN
ncbi:MAG: hypothetical protein HKN45_10820 [Flavobacteriales bacterium]|nr:hypothetical protein [Flavobacteriales bacterium]